MTHATQEFLSELLVACLFLLIPVIVIISLLKDPKDPLKKVSRYDKVEYNGHTYIENDRLKVIFHDLDCTNSKCFKE